MSLKVEGLSKRFGTDWALRNVSLTAEPGQIFGVYGAKGSGKTTLLRLIAGREKPDSGTITLGSKDVEFVPTVPISSFWQRAMGGARFDTVDIADRQISSVHSALNGSAKIILLDDPFCFLDRSLRDELVSELKRRVHGSDKAVIVTARDVEDLYAAADTIAIIDKGETAQIGSPVDIYESPATIACARSTGRINLFEARRLTSSKSDNPEFQTISGEHRLFARRTDLAGLGAINQNVMLGIRPEHISISFGASFPEDNLLKAKVTAVKFRGPTTIVEFDAEGLQIEAVVLRLVGLQEGDECMVGLPPERLSILKK